MQIKVVPHREDIYDLSPGERLIHLAFRPDVKDVLHILDMCPKIEAIEVPASYRRTLSRAVPILLELKKVDLLEGEVQGHRRDLSAYYKVPERAIEIVKDMKAQGKAPNDILHVLARTYLVKKDLAAYMVKTL